MFLINSSYLPQSSVSLVPFQTPSHDLMTQSKRERYLAQMYESI